MFGFVFARICALFSGVLAHPPEDEMENWKQPQPNTQNGQMSGVLGGFFRYYHVYGKGPNEVDEARAVEMADDVRCEVCEVILGSALAKYTTLDSLQIDAATDVTRDLTSEDRGPKLSDILHKSGPNTLSEEKLLEHLEGHLEYVAAQKQGERIDEVKEKVASKRAGCNRLFKEEFLEKGWRVDPCPAIHPKGQKAPCVTKSPVAPSIHSINTYELWKEGVFFACEQSFAQYRDEMAGMVVTNVGMRVKNLVSKVCKEAAKCDRRLGPKAPEEAEATKKMSSQTLEEEYSAPASKGGQAVSGEKSSDTVLSDAKKKGKKTKGAKDSKKKGAKDSRKARKKKGGSKKERKAKRRGAGRKGKKNRKAKSSSTKQEL